MFFMYVFAFFIYGFDCYANEEKLEATVLSSSASTEKYTEEVIPYNNSFSLFGNTDSEIEGENAQAAVIGEHTEELSDSPGTLLRFKIGFEFQEANHLCPWAFTKYQIQKQPIFYVTHNERTLWSLVIDGMDLEFVTEPFANNEQELIERSVRSIEEACRTLKQLHAGRKKEGMSTDTLKFENWLCGEAIFSEQGCIRKSGLFDHFGCDLETTGLYWQVKDCFFSFGKFEDIKFQPQMTVQLPIEKIIPVLLCLYGTNDSFYISEITELLSCFNGKKPPESLKDILTVLGNMQSSITLSNNQIKNISKEYSFLFLFLFHLQELTKSINCSDSENQRLYSLYRDYMQYHQINAKRELTLLSRRPLSVVWQDIVDNLDQASSFQDVVGEHTSTEYLYEISNKIKLVNYGKKYRRAADGGSLNIAYLDDNYIPNTIERWFINNGIVAASLLRIYDPSTFADSLNKIIISIEDPSAVIRPFVVIKDGALEGIEEKISEYDLLSPPIFLPDTDSMGAFKDQEIDLAYGEGIFEFRYIRCISQFALNRIKDKISEIHKNNEGNPKLQFLDFLGFIKEDSNDMSSLLSSVKGLLMVLEDIIVKGN